MNTASIYIYPENIVCLFLDETWLELNIQQVDHENKVFPERLGSAYRSVHRV